MSILDAQLGELRATIHITRKETGRIDTVEIVGHHDPEKLQQILVEQQATTPPKEA